MKFKSFQHKYNNPHCHHIVSIYQKQNPVPQYSGNLFLSGVGAFKKNIIKDYGISSALTIMDQWTYNYNDMDKKLQENSLIGHHKWIDLQDTMDGSIYPHFEEAIQFIQTNLKDKNVLVHCHMGISRSASIVLAFLMKNFGMSLDDAYKHTAEIRDTISPNQAFWKDLQRYQKVLKNKEQIM